MTGAASEAGQLDAADVRKLLALQGYRDLPASDVDEIVGRLDALTRGLLDTDALAPFDDEPWAEWPTGAAAGGEAPTAGAVAGAAASDLGGGTPAGSTGPEGAPLHLLGALEQARLMEAGTLTSRALVERYLERIERLDPIFRAFITVCADDALRAADRADEERRAGRVRSPLHGVPYGVKDQMLVEGVRLTGGSRVLRDVVGHRDATVVARLRAAGAVFLGTLNTHEFHSGLTRDFPFGVPRNPWNPDHTPGASSAGSAAAVAAGLCSFSLGGDTGGSVRAPAAYCGVVGLKATWSRVSRDGVIPLAWSMDCVGPLTRRVEDAAAVLAVLAGHDPRDPTSSRRTVPDYLGALTERLDGLRVGLVEETVDPTIMGAEAIAATEAALEVLRSLGAEVVRLSVPLVHETRSISTALVHSEAASHHRKWLLGHYLDYDASTRIGFLTGALLPAGLRGQAERLRMKVAKQVVAALEGVDALATPAADLAPPIAPPASTTAPADGLASLRMPGKAMGPQTRVFSLSGHPSLSVPAGFSEAGLPLGLQLATRHFDEATLLRTAHAYERAAGWSRREPAAAA